jgi:uncharacterized protein with NAD-binding domain and iron-sulfur cluster
MPAGQEGPQTRSEPINVAIIGGGCASIAAAFELSRSPELRSRYRVTVYQVGWRLGGKGASGRGPAGRIEEHGLHLWMGFYENAFRLLRECYVELDRKAGTCPIVDWLDAFYKAPLAGVADWAPDGHWSIWTALLPPGGGDPGDPGRRHPRWTIADYLLRSLALVGALLERVAISDVDERRRQASLLEGPPDAVIRNWIQLVRRLGPLAPLSVLIEATRLVQMVLGTMPTDAFESIRRLSDEVANSARAQLKALLQTDNERRRVWEIIDILLAVVRGSLKHGLLFHPDGFNAIDDHDCRQWLQDNGASPDSVNSAFVRGLHDLALAFEDGDPARPRFAAGQGLRGSFRAFFNYRGAFFWKMRAGMGDVVFAPFYEVLKRRGVRFEFFHRLRNVRLSKESSSQRDQQPYVEALEFDVQATTVDGDEYRPLVDVGGLPCWPSQPDWNQLVHGERLAKAGIDFESHCENHRVRSKVLRVGDEFDLVVLGIGLGAVPYVCSELIARSQRWRDMVERVPTVATQAFQIWMNEDMKTLGWATPPLSSLGAFVDPFGTWADMTQLVPREDWPIPPRAVAYFCGALEEAGGLDSAALRERVRQEAVHFLDHEIGTLWPNAVTMPGKFRWELLVDWQSGNGQSTSGLSDERRFESQFWTANVNPSDRYIQSFARSTAYRISPLEQQFANLTIAGDWTDCNLNIGCVEAAFMSGRLAAHALSQEPPLEDIVGFDHP